MSGSASSSSSSSSGTSSLNTTKTKSSSKEKEKDKPRSPRGGTGTGESHHHGQQQHHGSPNGGLSAGSGDGGDVSQGISPNTKRKRSVSFADPPAKTSSFSNLVAASSASDVTSVVVATPASSLPSSSSSSSSVVVDDSKLDQLFEKVLDELGLPPAKAEAMRQMPNDRKRIMVQQFLERQNANGSSSSSSKSKSSSSSPSSSSLSTPNAYVEKLRGYSTTGSWPLSTVSSLRVALTGNPVSWINKFIELQGFALILDILRFLERKGGEKEDEEKSMEIECVFCLKAMLNTQAGIEEVLVVPDALKTIVLHLTIQQEKALAVLFDLLTAVCLIPGPGHRLTVDALTHFSVVKREKTRFYTVVDVLRQTSKYREATLVSCLTFVNALVNSPENINTRSRLRQELQFLGFKVVAQNLRQLKSLELDQLLDVYDEESEADHHELLQQVAEMGVDVNDPMDMTSYLKKNISSDSLPFFLSALRNFLRFPDQNAGLKCWVVADHLLEELAAQRDTVVNSDEAKFSLQAVIGSLTDREKLTAAETKVNTLQAFVNIQQQQINELQKKLNQAQSQPRGNGAATAVDHRRCRLELSRVEQMFEDALDALNQDKRIRIERLEKELAALKKKNDQEQNYFNRKLESKEKECKKVADELRTAQQTIASLKLSAATEKTVQPEESNQSPPASEEPSSTATEGESPSVPPPPPPVATQSGSSSNLRAAPVKFALPPPPPPIPGKTPPPPPPPGGKSGGPPAPAFSKQVLALPPKPTIKTSVKMKQLQWTKIPNIKIPNTIWVNLSDQNVALDVEELEKTFAAPVSTQKVGGFRPKVTAITLIETKRANNTAIMLSRFKIPYEQIKQAIMDADEEQLPFDKLSALLQFAPTVEEMTLIRDFTGDRDKLGVAEKFFSVMMTIPRYKQKLEALFCKASFAAQIKDIKPLLSTVLAATKEVYDNEKLAKLLEIVLAVGNFMNSNTTRGAAYGFTLSSINALTDTKSTDNKITLLHYLIRHLEKTYPEVLAVPDSMAHVKPATRVAYQSLMNETNQLRLHLDKVSKEIPQIEEGAKLRDILSVWLEEAKEQFVEIEAQAKEMEESFQKLCLAFGEDPKNMQPDVLFSMLLKFLTNFEKAIADNKRIQAMAEREAAKKARAAQMASKKAGAKEAEDGVMDKLIASVRDGELWRQRRLGGVATSLPAESSSSSSPSPNASADAPSSSSTTSTS